MDRKGALFETFIFNQMTDTLNATGNPFELSFFRTEHGAEVDFILELGRELIAIEVKASQNIGSSDLAGFRSLEEFLGKKIKCYILYLGTTSKVINGVQIRPWADGLNEILG
jgi:uncharacterized protein